MIRCRTMTSIAIACLLAASGCGGDDDGGSTTPVPTVPKASPTRTSPAAPTRTSTTAVSLPTATASPTPTEGTSELAGDYSSTIALEGTQEAHLDLAVAADSSASGTLEIVEVSATVLRHRSASVTSSLSISLGFVSLSGSIDPSSGTFHFAGNIDGPEGAIPFDLSGTLPSSPEGSGSVTLAVAGQSYSSTISAGAGPTPLPTSSAPPTPTAVAGGCGHGVFGANFSNVVDSNMVDRSQQAIGNVTAISSGDGIGGFIWVISAAQCGLVLGDVSHNVIIQGSGLTTPIQAGTYALGTATPPFVGVTYSETLYNPLAPAGNYQHAWGSTGGTLTLTDAGGGAFTVHIAAPMGEHVLLHSGTGTFDLDVSGTIDQVGP